MPPNVIAPRVVTPELFGAKGDGVTDDTAAMQRWADEIAKVNRGRFMADNIYRVSDTITFESITGVQMNIGTANLDAFNLRSTDGVGTRSGILYDGNPGTGPEPENCRPAVWIQQLNFAQIDSIIVSQYKDTAETNTTGILFSTGTTGQRGNSKIGILGANNFYRGIIFGLYQRTGGLIGHAATGYADDVLEGCHISQAIATGCPAPFYFSCFSSDQTVFDQLYADAYQPNDTTGDLGLASYAIDISTAGNLLINSMGCFHCRLGVEKKLVTEVSAANDTLTIPGHGWSDGQFVYIYPTNGSTLPAGLFDAEYTYFIVQSTTDTIKLSLTSGGGPVDITDIGTGSFWVVRVANTEASLRANNCTLDIKRFACENHHAYAISDTFTVTGRNVQQIYNLNSNYGSKNISDYSMNLIRPWRFVNCTFGGFVVYREQIDMINPVFLINRKTTQPYAAIAAGGYTPTPPTIINSRSKDWDTDAVSADTLSRGIITGTGSPEGNVRAPIGYLYINLNGGSGTTLYIKESAPTLTTGWVGK